VIENSANLAKTYAGLAAMKNWMQQSLAGASAADPIHVQTTSTDYFTQDGQLQASRNGGPFESVALDQLTPTEFSQIALAIAEKQGSSTDPAFAGWLSAFDAEYSVPVNSHL
jgi:hypothetical protein